jgi:lipopolysaccharide transport system permease protein
MIENLIKLAFLDLKERYHGSLIGPFANTISLFLIISCIYFVFSNVLNINKQSYFFNISMGLAIWLSLVNTYSECMQSILLNKPLLLNIKINPIFFVIKDWIKNFYLFFYSFIPILIINIFLDNFTYMSILISLFGVLLLNLFIIFTALSLSIVNVFFRDIQYLFLNFLQLLFYLTPILWDINQFNLNSQLATLIKINPFYHFLSIIRSNPDSLISITSLTISLLYLLIALIVFIFVYRKYKLLITISL